MQLIRALAVAVLATQAVALSIGARRMTVERGSDTLQDIVSYDEHSLIVHGERVMVFSGEFHPFRLPVPDLWLDVFQKVKALGFSAVSFYVHWALLEGERGVYCADGIFALESFFEAALQAGIYLIARPGPYINAESSGGGFPGWLQRVKGQLRSSAPDYLAATDNYVANIGATVAKAQITNGGPVILLQPENEYSGGAVNTEGGFPNPDYFAYVKKQYRDAGIVVPFINNDAWNQGLFAPGEVVNGTTIGDVDIYGHDSYPMGFDCSNPSVWVAGSIPTYFHASHEQESPSTFYAIPEFQGGSIDFWGGSGYDKCALLLNMEFERVLYKNNFASGSALLNLYMIYGGTNWGNLGYPGVYTSYDYGSAITENREVFREKYSELKLEANFLKVTPAFLTSSVGDSKNGTYTTNIDIFTTPLWGNGSATNLYVVRHADFQQLTAATYQLSVNTSHGSLVIPQLGGSLTLSGRDSKWHVTDYSLGGITLLYSTAEIFTWQNFEQKTVLVVYGGPGELHELAVITSKPATLVEGSGVTTKSIGGTTILNWQTSSSRRIVQVGSLFVYLLDRNSAYNYWVPDVLQDGQLVQDFSSSGAKSSVIVDAGYLVRTAKIQGSNLYITGDLNATTTIKVIGAPPNTKSLYFNGQKLRLSVDGATGDLSSTLQYTEPKIDLPNLSSLPWKYIDNLPEVQSSYDDSVWTKADHITSNNPIALKTPTSLYGSDYGYNAGTLIYRGHFVATGSEKTLQVWSQGGTGYGTSVWLNSFYLGSWSGNAVSLDYNSTYTLPQLVVGKAYIFTILVDNNGLDENWEVGGDDMKSPRGILNYTLSSRGQSAISWKLTGNLGGEQYIDKVRGPLNEGGLYAERQGFTQPDPPNDHWVAGNPETGITKAGVAFYQTSFELNIPRGYDVPLTFNFGNTTIEGAVAEYRAQLWVNGYQFGKYINNIGPQTSFPVPQGILNYYGRNWIAIELWAEQANGGHLTDFTLNAGTPVLTSMKAPALVPMPGYSKRPGAY